MESQDEHFLVALREAFAIEAAEHLDGLASGLLDLEKLDDEAARAPFVETIYREIHSLKGAARAVDNLPIEAICQALENLLALWKRGQLAVSPELFDALHQASDAAADLLLRPGNAPRAGSVAEIVARLSTFLDASSRREVSSPVATLALENSANEGTSSAPAAALHLSSAPQSAPLNAVVARDANSLREHEITGITKANSSDLVAPTATVAVAKNNAPTDETVRIAASKLDELLRGAEELLLWKQIAGERAAQLQDTRAQFALWHREWQKLAPQLTEKPRLSAKSGEKTSDWHKLADFSHWNQQFISRIETSVAGVARAAEADRRALGGLIDNLLDEAKQLLMLPFSHISGVFARVVRDVAREQGKDVWFELRGEGVELDKRILEALKEPLIHLLRNSVDHGVEAPDERERCGKSRTARIEMEVSQRGSEVEISLSDNGGGIDEQAVTASALRAGLISGEEAARLTPDAARWLIFQSSLSTSALVTEISGRGLGMTIVREKVEALGGRIELESERSVGTTFRLFLPLTLATFRGVLVEASGQDFVLPAADVERVVRVSSGDLGLVHGQLTLTLPRAEVGRDLISLVGLSEVLGLKEAPYSPPKLAISAHEGWKIAVVLHRGGERLAFEVESVQGEQEVLVKPLPHPLLRVRNIAGATISGSGQVVPILNAADLFQSAQQIRFTRPLSDSHAAPDVPASPRRILVAEDSITSRMLLKNILESAGYSVTTAVDGLDALNLLQASDFDLLVSDVDMPNLSGLDLTARVRAEPKISALPVVLVTSRSTREDLERGVDVGANAYIVKSRFDQHDLLEVVARFV